MKKHKPHDSYFKNLFEDLVKAKSFIENYTPDFVKSTIDTSTLALSKDSFVDQRLKKFYSDLIFTANIAGRKGFIYLLFDHKSSPAPLVAFHLEKYVNKIWDRSLKNKAQKLPTVLPIVFYHGKDKWNIGRKLSDLVDCENKSFLKYIPNFEYLLIDLSEFSDEELKGDIGLVIGLSLFKHAFDETEQIDAFIIKLKEKIRTVGSTPEGMNDLEAFLEYLLSTQVSQTKAIKVFEESLPEEGGKLVMSVAEKLRTEGRTEGRIKGKEEGLLEGEHKKQVEIAKNMLKKGYEIKAISEVTGLPIKEIKKLSNQD